MPRDDRYAHEALKHTGRRRSEQQHTSDEAARVAALERRNRSNRTRLQFGVNSVYLRGAIRVGHGKICLKSV